MVCTTGVWHMNIIVRLVLLIVNKHAMRATDQNRMKEMRNIERYARLFSSFYVTRSTCNNVIEE